MQTASNILTTNLTLEVDIKNVLESQQLQVLGRKLDRIFI